MAEKFTRPLFVRCPPSMTKLIEEVAESRFTTVSEYVRGALVERLRSDVGEVDSGEIIGDANATL